MLIFLILLTEQILVCASRTLSLHFCVVADRSFTTARSSNTPMLVERMTVSSFARWQGEVLLKKQM